jgi:hypothetical protein
MVQNAGRITMSYERISGALEQGIELGNQLLSGKELSLASLAFVLNENELWLVMKALRIQPDTAKCGRSLTLPISDNGLPCADDFATRTVD